MCICIDVIRAIRDAAFASNSYPVTLSIENHCSFPQQRRMAEIMQEVLGDMLYVQDHNDAILPGPEALKKKILIKGKRLKEHTGLEVTEEEEDEEADEELENSKELTTVAGSNALALGDEHTADGSSDLAVSDVVLAIQAPEKAKKDKHKLAKVCEELSLITYLATAKLKQFYDPDPNYVRKPANVMCSYSEPKTQKLLKKALTGWIQHNRIHIRCVCTSFEGVVSVVLICGCSHIVVSTLSAVAWTHRTWIPCWAGWPVTRWWL